MNKTLTQVLLLILVLIVNVPSSEARNALSGSVGLFNSSQDVDWVFKLSIDRKTRRFMKTFYYSHSSPFPFTGNYPDALSANESYTSISRVNVGYMEGPHYSYRYESFFFQYGLGLTIKDITKESCPTSIPMTNGFCDYNEFESSSSYRYLPHGATRIGADFMLGRVQVGTDFEIMTDFTDLMYGMSFSFKLSS